MKKILFVFFLLLQTSKIFAQQFSQINSGTLYDSFENPSQKAFTTDTSRKYAFNFFIPNFNADLFFIGDAQNTLKSRQFSGMYNNTALKIGKGNLNHATISANAYLLMFKMFSSFNGDQELGFSWQTRAEGKGTFSDESAAIFNGSASFNDGTYNNIFNDHYYLQTYHQISFTYKEKISKQLAVGVKLSALLGLEYQELDITGSSISFDKANNQAILMLDGANYTSENTGFSSATYTPSFKNPGASISMGATYKTRDNFILQANVKDLGFIHWSSNSNNYLFAYSRLITDLTSPAREANVFNAIKGIASANSSDYLGSFTIPTDGRLELSANRTYWFDYDKTFKYSPTLVVSKELFYQGAVIALVNPFQYNSFTATLTTTYNDLKAFNVGGQLMIKKTDWEFFIGSDSLLPTARLGYDALKQQPSYGTSFTEGNIFLGFSVKFGAVTEHPMNSSTVPIGEEKGFLGRFFDSIFKSKRVL